MRHYATLAQRTVSRKRLKTNAWLPLQLRYNVRARVFMSQGTPTDFT